MFLGLLFTLHLISVNALAAGPSCGPLFDNPPAQAEQAKISKTYDLGEEVGHLLQGIANSHVTMHEIDSLFIKGAFQTLPEIMDPVKVLFLESDVAFLKNIKLHESSELILDIVDKKDYSKLTTLVKKLEQRRQEFFSNLDFIASSKTQSRLVYTMAIKSDSPDRFIHLNGRRLSFDTAHRYVSKNWPKNKEQDFEHLKVILAGYMVPLLKTQMSIEDAFVVAVARIRRDMEEDASVRGDPRIFVYLAKAFFKNLDPHSAFASPKEFSEYNIATSRRIAIGVYPLDVPNGLLITKVSEDSLASHAGLKEGDVIVTINSVPTTRFMQRGLAKFLRAQENPVLKLEIERKGKLQQVILDRSVEVFREQTPIRFNVQATNKKQKIADIGFHSFYPGLAKDVRAALTKANEQGVSGIILDLRHNGGGLLYEAKQVLKMLITTNEPFWYSKTNAQIISSDQARLGPVVAGETYAPMFNGRVIVLVDNLSASASELTASVLKSFGRAIIVGARATYGKGSSQDNIRVSMGGLKITSGLFYNRFGESPQYHGVESDIVIGRAEVFGAEQERNLPGVIIAEDIAKLTTDAEPVIAEIANLRERSEERQKAPRENVEDPVMLEAQRILSDWLNIKP
ncbi:MAG: PDZ domain-containing protein [Bdellovibrionales bacterium]|nr:PDZ domain-containing protein [Bdellovibrionales bacterium]